MQGGRGEGAGEGEVVESSPLEPLRVGRGCGSYEYAEDKGVGRREVAWCDPPCPVR